MGPTNLVVGHLPPFSVGLEIWGNLLEALLKWNKMKIFLPVPFSGNLPTA